MSRINISELKHFHREEEKEMFRYISKGKDKCHVSVFGQSGTGKTETISVTIKKMHSGSLIKKYSILHFDAAQVKDNCDSNLFYNLLIYKLLKEADVNDKNLTYVTKSHTFLSFLENTSYKKEAKENIKRALIASLSLLPTIGSLIYDKLNIKGDNLAKNYYTNQYIFSEYIDYLSEKTGIIVFIDNIQCLTMEILNGFYDLLRQLKGQIYLFTSYTIKSDLDITKELIEEHRLDNDSLAIHIKNIKKTMFDEICEQNLSQNQYNCVKERLDYFYTLVQYGNMREIDELIFQINNLGAENINNETPTIQGLKALDEIKKDIVDLASLFPEGIKLSFIERIIKYNHNCSKAQLHQSVSELCKMKYVLLGENGTIKIEHDKISQASRQKLELTCEEDRFVELIATCEKVFSDILYEPIDDSDFVFCMDGLMEFEKQFNFLKYLGVLEKYINILYVKFRYYQICQLYRNLLNSINDGNKIVLLFPVRSIIQILDSFQKTSCFSEGLEISSQLSNYYNMDTYKAKFLLQSYHYQKAISTLVNKLNNYESWSIYLNALQHLRQDNKVKKKVISLMKKDRQYSDMEYYYIILRNSGHLFDFNISIRNLQQALTYFQNSNNKFVEATCLNNMGILYLYQNQNQENICIARKYFTQAQTIMSKLRSSEEYQSIINIGVSFLCENNPTLALDYFETAQAIVPFSLKFDMIKLKCNILICKYIMNRDDIIYIRKELLNLFSQAEELPDPWIKLLCLYNLRILREGNNSDIKVLQDDYPGNINLYGLILKRHDLEGFMLGVSPHWRY